MRSVILITILCACVVAWGMNNDSQKMRQSLFELKLDQTDDLLTAQWAEALKISESDLLVKKNEQLKTHRAAPTKMLAGTQQIAIKRSAIGAVANTDYLGDLPSDAAYQPPEGSSDEGTTDAKAKAMKDAKKKGLRDNGMGSIANTGQLGDAPSDNNAYQGGADTASSSGQSAGTAQQQATAEAKKKQVHANLMGTVTNGGQWDDNNGENYQTDIAPAKSSAKAPEDRIPYLIKQLSTAQHPSYNPVDIQRDVRREMMKQQTTTQPKPYNDL